MTQTHFCKYIYCILQSFSVVNDNMSKIILNLKHVCVNLNDLLNMFMYMIQHISVSFALELNQSLLQALSKALKQASGVL